MIKIEEGQFLQMKDALDNSFIYRVVAHLNRIRSDENPTFDAQSVRGVVETLRSIGLEKERDIVAAIEAIKLYGIDLAAPEHRANIENEHVAASHKVRLLEDAALAGMAG